MRILDLDSAENINGYLKEIFSQFSLPASAIPQLDEKYQKLISSDAKEFITLDENDEKDTEMLNQLSETEIAQKLNMALKDLMNAQNPHLKMTNKKILLDNLYILLEKYNSQEIRKPVGLKLDTQQDDFEMIIKNTGLLLSTSIYDREDIKYKKLLQDLLAAAQRRNDVVSICYISSMLEINVELSQQNAVLHLLINNAVRKIALQFKDQGLILDEKEISQFRSMVDELDVSNDFVVALLDICHGVKEYTLEQLLSIVLQGDCSQAELDIAKFLKTHGVKASINDVELLTTALLKGPAEFRLVKDEIKNINAQDSEGNTAIMKVLQLSSSDSEFNLLRLMAFSLLLDQGVNLNLRNKNGDTVLIVAASLHLDDYVARILENKGVEINAKNAQGHTAILAAVVSNLTRIKNNINYMEKGLQYSFESTLRFLVSNEGDINVKDRNGDNALLLAIKAKDKDTIEILLKLDADPESCDGNGKTAGSYK